MNFQQAGQLQQKQLAAEPALRPTSIRASLKAATDESHGRLDRLAARFDLSSDTGYRNFLTASAAALLPVETALEQAGVAHLFGDWPARRRSQAILDDLGGMGSDVPGSKAVEPPASPAGIFGMLYVLEGSRLGARTVLKQLEAASERARRNLRYLSHGSDANLWRSFTARLETEAAVLGDVATTIAAARDAFAVFLDRFAARPAA